LRTAIALVLLIALDARSSIASDGGAGPPSSPTPGCNDAVECRSRGEQYYFGRGVPKDRKIGIQYYQLGCDKGDPGSCVNLASVLFAGMSVPMDEARALGLYQRACDLGYVSACANAAQMLEQGSSAPGAVPRDLAHAAKLYEQACTANDACACMNLSELYAKGGGVKKDARRAAALRRRGKKGGCDPRE
jgi:TPR repeat protein